MHSERLLAFDEIVSPPHFSIPHTKADPLYDNRTTTFVIPEIAIDFRNPVKKSAALRRVGLTGLRYPMGINLRPE